MFRNECALCSEQTSSLIGFVPIYNEEATAFPKHPVNINPLHTPTMWPSIIFLLSKYRDWFPDINISARIPQWWAPSQNRLRLRQSSGQSSGIPGATGWGSSEKKPRVLSENATWGKPKQSGETCWFWDTFHKPLGSLPLHLSSPGAGSDPALPKPLWHGGAPRRPEPLLMFSLRHLSVLRADPSGLWIIRCRWINSATVSIS